MIKFIEAVLILSGMIIGVGMFGIPFSFVRAGFWLGALELAVLTGLMVLFHLLYARIILVTPVPHRLPGYVEFHLGRRAEILAVLSSFFGIIGSLLAYILIGSVFLHNIFQSFWAGSSEMFWAIAITLSSALATLFSSKKEALIDSALSAALILFLGYVVFILFPRVETANFSGMNFGEAFLPYGVLLFALAGGAAIPNVVTILGKDMKKVGLAILVGTLIPAIIYFLFAFTVVGSVGSGVSEEAIDSLKTVLSGNMVILLSLIGFLSVYDSYIILNSNAQALLKLDFRFGQKIAWLLATLVPFALYAMGLQNFILIIGASGAIAVGIEAGLIMAVYERVRQKQGRVATPASYLWKAPVFLMVTAGVLYELYRIYVN